MKMGWGAGRNKHLALTTQGLGAPLATSRYPDERVERNPQWRTFLDGDVKENVKMRGLTDELMNGYFHTNAVWMGMRWGD